MKKHLLKTVLLAVGLLLGTTSTWADEIEIPTPKYFNDFSSEDGLTKVGNGIFEDDSNPAFGKIFHNDPTNSSAIRSNYLKLPETVLSYSAASKEITIGFWVNKKSEDDFFWTPLFSAHDQAPTAGTLANETAGLVNEWTMFVCETRGLLFYNLNEHQGGWCDFTDAQNDNSDKKNVASSVWLDDGQWHYYTVTLTTNKAVVYNDGNIANSWTISDASAFFDNISKLTYVTLGGNQYAAWADPDPAFGFDDFAVYDVALSADQIKQIVNKKNALSAVARCKAWETSAAFATAIDAKLAAGDFNTADDVYAFHTNWQVTNGSLSKVIINNEVTSTTGWVGTSGSLTAGADYAGHPDYVYLAHMGDYNVNQTVYSLPAGTYQVSAWTYASAEADRNIYVATVNPWADIVNASLTPTAATSAEGWKQVKACFTLAEPTTIAFGFFAGKKDGVTFGFDNWQLEKVPTGTVVGATDFTKSYLGAYSTPVTLSPNQKATYTFYNYSDMAEIWDNWLACVGGETFDIAALKLVLRADPYEPVQGSGEGITVNESYDNLYSEIDGAKVELSFTYQNNAVTVRADITAKSGNTYFEEFTKTGITGDITVALSVEKSFLVITDQQKKVLAETKVMTDAGWATYFSANALDLTGEIANLTDAYIITGGNNTTKYVYKESVKGKIVPAKVGLLLEGTAGEIVFPVADADATTDAAGNALVGVTAEETLPAEAGYVLLKENEVVAFYKNLNPFTLNANTAYLPANFAPSISEAPRFYALDGETTGIDNLNVDAEASKAEGTIYNLAGQRVSKDYKGLVILNGKKVIIK